MRHIALTRPGTVIAQSLASSGRKPKSTWSFETSSNASVMVDWQYVSFGHNARRSTSRSACFTTSFCACLRSALVIAASQPYSFSFFCCFCTRWCPPCGGKGFPAHIEYDAAEWLERKRMLESWTVEQWTSEPAPGRTCDKRTIFQDALWVIAADNDFMHPLAVAVGRGLRGCSRLFVALFFQPLFLQAPVSTLWWQTCPAHIEYDAAEWLDRKRKLENWTTVQWFNGQGPNRTWDRRRYQEALWLLAADEDVLWGVPLPTQDKGCFLLRHGPHG